MAPDPAWQGHSGWVLCVAWSPDAAILATGGMDSSLWLWDPRTGRALGTCKGERGPPSNACCSAMLSCHAMADRCAAFSGAPPGHVAAQAQQRVGASEHCHAPPC